MHFSTIASSVLLVVSGVTAAPNLVVRDIAAEVALYTGRGCTGDGVRFGTAFPPDDGSCFVIPQNQGIANSGMIDTPIPAGCTPYETRRQQRLYVAQLNQQSSSDAGRASASRENSGLNEEMGKEKSGSKMERIMGARTGGRS
ncbi:hypothetical protein M501DRAFT_1018801 [Patellaria atrata CBS 101060]|uniref:Uncharacterized protein n=1 Tax=Patellaria atrata CBS 101060 TaxID=1346257 RepID=A0A9P4VMA6_9PEZI|nr:hypothetical protein M501DRAFT_1018801 [Patellaria atrata CBS 101060]